MRDANASFATAVETFLAANTFAQKSISDYGRYLREFDKFTNEQSLREALTLDNAKRWLALVRMRGPAVATNSASYLKSFASWLAKNRYLYGPDDGSVLARLPVPRTAPPERPRLSAAQWAEIWAALEEWPRPKDRLRATAFMRLMQSTGMKKNQARILLRDDVHLSRGWVAVPTAKGKVRRSIDRKTVAAITEYLANRPAHTGKTKETFLLTRKGTGFTEWGFSTWVDHVWQEIARLTPSGVKASSNTVRRTWQLEGTEPIRDERLRSRCAKYLGALEHHDQAVREACVVLEDRVRERTAGQADQIGTSLMEWAFAADAPQVRLAEHRQEQRGAMEIYRGVIGFYRNGTGHRLRDDFDPDEAIRIVRWIDHLLWLLDHP